MTINRILVATDFSKYSDAAVMHSCDLAIALGAELHLIHVIAGDFDEDRRRRTLAKLDNALQPQCDLELDVRRKALGGVVD